MRNVLIGAVEEIVDLPRKNAEVWKYHTGGDKYLMNLEKQHKELTRDTCMLV